MTSCWCRSTQPAKISIRKCSGRAFVGLSSGQQGTEGRAEIVDLALAKATEVVRVLVWLTFGTLRHL